jgi:hypothetical protein
MPISHDDLEMLPDLDATRKPVIDSVTTCSECDVHRQREPGRGIAGYVSLPRAWPTAPTPQEASRYDGRNPA